MSNATINRLSRRGPSARPAPCYRAFRGSRAPQTQPTGSDSATVIRARRRILEGYYENDEILSVALDYLIESVACELGRSSIK